MAALTVSPSLVWPAIHATSSAMPIRQDRPSLSTSTGAIASGGGLVDDDGAIPGTAVQPSHHLTRPVSSTPLTGATRSPCAIPQTALAMCRSAVRYRAALCSKGEALGGCMFWPSVERFAGQPEGTILCFRNFKPRLCLLGRHGALLHPTIRSNDNGPCCCD